MMKCIDSYSNLSIMFYHMVSQSRSGGVCDSEGEIYPDEVDNIIVDSDGIHRLQ